MMSMSERLKRARQHRGWRQTDLAQAANIGVATIRRVEQSTIEPRLSTARRMADALEIRVEWLLFGAGDMTDESSEDRSR
jgi:ribosome-binding protein aMBF1 (putative translation factor)